MKIALFVLLAVLTFVLGDYTPGHNGRSACSSQEEIDTKYYANNFDPTKYWHCEAMNVPATDKQCGVERAFHQKKRECVPWNQWQWFPYDDPPNKA